jgi:alpha/beta superfamily hydrolase|tara:strand:+ start:3115 stop:3864 length:750 start_codon:yes stop_codon:yes gene_type:complete
VIITAAYYTRAMQIRNKHGEKIDHAMHDVAGVNDKLIILAHGVTGDMDREFMVELAQMLAKMGWPTMRISFSGNGNSEGHFTDSTISKECDDLVAVLDQAKGVKKVAYIGYSMGGAVGALTAAKDDRISVLVSLAGMVRTKLFAETEYGDVIPDKGFMWDDETTPLSQKFMDDLRQIDTVIPAVKDLRLPWLLLHGSEDDVVLPDDSAYLFNHLKGKKKHVVINGTDHSFAGHWEDLAGEIDDWLKTYL